MSDFIKYFICPLYKPRLLRLTASTLAGWAILVAHVILGLLISLQCQAWILIYRVGLRSSEKAVGYLHRSWDYCTNGQSCLAWGSNISLLIAWLNSLIKSPGPEVITIQFLKYIQGYLWYLFSSWIYRISAFTKLRVLPWGLQTFPLSPASSCLWIPHHIY